MLNEYLNAKARRHIQADYERRFKQYEALPQPKVTAVDADINIYPERRSFDGNVRITLQNKTGRPVSQIHLTDQKQSVSNIRFDRPYHLVGSRRVAFTRFMPWSSLCRPGKRSPLPATSATRAEDSAMATSCRSWPTTAPFSTPTTCRMSAITGTSSWTIRAVAARRTCPIGRDGPSRGSRSFVEQHLLPIESDWVTYHTVVSTSADQMVLAPGYLQREWRNDGRHFFEYSMGSTHMLDFFAYISARYQIRKERYHGPSGDVALEVYYDPAHSYDVDDMLASSRAGLDYYQRIYSPYQFTQYRILEFPRYRAFAQSFPNTVPYSEAWVSSAGW